MRPNHIAIVLFLSACGIAAAQAPAAPVAGLVEEAEHANPRIQAAEHLWEAAQHAVGPASSLPDPQVSLQQMTVGSPLPFAGYTTSNFAFTGIGVTQDLPVPGKLRLRGEAAQSDADVRRTELDAIRREIASDVRTTYIQLAYLQAVRGVLRQDQDLLTRMERIAEERYANGQISQAAALEAQSNQTGILRDLQMNDRQARIVEAQLRLLLARPATSPDIVAEPLQQSPAGEPPPEPSPANDPNLAARQAMLAGSASRVALARKNLIPDFTAGYMYEKTGPGFPDYYQWTLGWSLPIHRSRDQRQELAEAVEEHAAAQDSYTAAADQDAFVIEQQADTIQSDETLIGILKEGLIPQANARLQAAMTAFQSGRGELQEVLDADQALLDLEQGYWHTLAEHETALVKLRQVTGPTSTEVGHE